jgi:hypothetical protein
MSSTPELYNQLFLSQDKHLKEIFWNYLHLGQWEIARAVLLQLAASDFEEAKKILFTSISSLQPSEFTK